MSDPCETVLLGLEAALHDDHTTEGDPSPPVWLEHLASCRPCAALLRCEVRIVTALRAAARILPPAHALPEEAISSIVAAMVAALEARPISQASAG